MNFQEAVLCAKESLACVGDVSGEAERLSDFISYFCREGDASSLESIVAASADQLLSYEALGLAAAKLLETGDCLPPVLQGWVINVLRGKAVRPPKSSIAKSGWPGANNERDLLIYDTLKVLQEGGLTPTRNPTAQPTSGCDAVSEAMRLLGYPRLSFGTVKKIYETVGRKFKDGGDPRLGLEISNRVRRATRL